MKNISNLLIGIVCCFITVSCSDDNSVDFLNVGNEGEYYTTSKTVRTLKENAIQYIKEKVANGNMLTFDKAVPKEVIPSIGTIIYVPISEQTPNGFLGKVISVLDNGNQIDVYTETVPLFEAFPDFSMDTTFSIINSIEGIYDEKGEAIEFNIEYATDGQTSRSEKEDTLSIITWDHGKLIIPFKDAFGEEFEVDGNVGLTFSVGKCKIDSLGVDLAFSINSFLDVGITTEIKNFEEKKWETAPFTIRIPIPSPLPLFLSIPVCLKGELEAKATVSLQLQKSSTVDFHILYENKKWHKDNLVKCESHNENPFSINKFNFAGKLNAGISAKVEVRVVNNIAIGVEAFPNVELSGEAELSTLDPYKFNPEFTIKGDFKNKAFISANLFGKWGGLDIPLQDVVLFRRSLSLFPNVSELGFVEKEHSVGVSWVESSYCLLQTCGLKTGVTLYNSDGLLIESYYPEYIPMDKDGMRKYDITIGNLDANETYYIASTTSWPVFKYNYYGDKYKINTKGFNVDFNIEYPKYTDSYTDYITHGVDSADCAVGLSPIFEDENQQNNIIETYAVLYKDGEEVKRSSMMVEGRYYLYKTFGRDELNVDNKNYIAVPKEGHWQVSMLFKVLNEEGDTITIPSDIVKDVELKYDTKPVLFIYRCHIFSDKECDEHDENNSDIHSLSASVSCFIRGSFWRQSYIGNTDCEVLDGDVYFKATNDFLMGGGLSLDYTSSNRPQRLLMGVVDCNGKVIESNAVPIYTTTSGCAVNSVYDETLYFRSLYGSHWY